MKCSLFFFFFCACSAISSVDAGSVRLLNDSPYRLRAVVRGNDGAYLGEVIINPQHSSNWSDTYGQAGYAGKGLMENTYSQTPYTVLWYCMNGDDYAICNTVPTGGTVMAQSCMGSRMCKAEKKKEGPFTQPEGQYLNESQNVPSNPPE
ncbi:MAG: hypothetical protein ACM3JI_00410 [Anaerolineae bacterium]